MFYTLKRRSGEAWRITHEAASYAEIDKESAGDEEVLVATLCWPWYEGWRRAARPSYRGVLLEEPVRVHINETQPTEVA